MSYVYKLKNQKTNLYYAGKLEWDTKGKIYTNLAAVQSSITKSFLFTHPDFKEFKIIKYRLKQINVLNC